jgi:hypothetical protein
MVEKLICIYCRHESEPGDEVELYDRKRWKKQVALCADSIKCLERQLMKDRGNSIKTRNSNYLETVL